MSETRQRMREDRRNGERKKGRKKAAGEMRARDEPPQNSRDADPHGGVWNFRQGGKEARTWATDRFSLSSELK